MATVLNGVMSRQNVMLEMPTGTGKTMTVLSSLNAWQEKERASGNEVRQVFWVARTHTQLKQAHGEVKSFPDLTNVRTSTLASRHVSCSNLKVGSLPVGQRDKACVDLLASATGCSHHSNGRAGILVGKYGDSLMDIEDLLLQGRYALFLCFPVFIVPVMHTYVSLL
jgi:Rad3-related DNA helicase